MREPRRAAGIGRNLSVRAAARNKVIPPAFRAYLTIEPLVVWLAALKGNFPGELDALGVLIDVAVGSWARRVENEF